MISHKLKCIFVHIPKTAGSSIELALMRSSGEFQRLSLDDFAIDNVPPHAFGYNGTNPWDIKHVPPRYLKDVYRDYAKFCFVRNPWDLVVSCYFWWTQQAKMPFRQLQGKLLEQIGFSNFALSFYTDYINEIFHCGLGQCYWLLENDNKTICVNHIGRFENLQADFDAICQAIGLESTSLSMTNTSQHKPFREYYDEATAKLIKRKFAWDVQQFGYTF
jgi:hypothetical protein